MILTNTEIMTYVIIILFVLILQRSKSHEINKVKNDIFSIENRIHNYNLKELLLFSFTSILVSPVFAIRFILSKFKKLKK